MIPNHVCTAADRTVPWLNSFTVGDPRIDGEHRALIEVANDLCVQATLARPTGILQDAAREMLAVIEAHFEGEERAFAGIGYPAQQTHVREHLSVLSTLSDLLLGDSPVSAMVATATARLVLIEHILRHDLGVKTWLEEARSCQAAGR